MELLDHPPRRLPECPGMIPSAEPRRPRVEHWHLGATVTLLCQRQRPIVALSLVCLLAGACGGGAEPGMATLSWTPPDSANVTGYRVYYGTASRSYLQARGMGLSAGNATTHVVTGLPGGYRYFFAVTAVGANDEESDFSNEASKHIR